MASGSRRFSPSLLAADTLYLLYFTYAGEFDVEAEGKRLKQVMDK
jgi:hypothetical protein